MTRQSLTLQGSQPLPGPTGPAASGRGAPTTLDGSGAEAGTPAVVATVGTTSGTLGATLLPVLQGFQVWVQQINQRGGVHGHRVRLITFDDGGDPARHRAQ